MSKLNNGVFAAIAIVALAVTGNSRAAGSGAGTVPAAGARATIARGGVWAGKAWIVSGFLTKVEVPARGLIAANGMAYFLVRNFVLSIKLRSPQGSQYGLEGAPLFGTTWDKNILAGYYPVRWVMQKQALDLHWCVLMRSAPDICPGGENRLQLNYDGSNDSGSSLAKIAGHYADTLGQYKGVLTIAADGYVFMQDPATGCVVNGRVTLVNRAYNIYSIRLTYANCRSPTLKSASFSGLVSYGGPKRQLFALMLGTAAGIPAANRLEFVRQ